MRRTLAHRLAAFVGLELAAVREAAPSAGVYELVDELPPGPPRAAAWNAYALQVYGDKLLAAVGGSERARVETMRYAEECHGLAAAWAARARGEAARPLPERLPRWPSPLRSQPQLRGMREALEALRTHVAYELGRDGAQHDALAAVDERLHTVDLLWIERPPDELRGGIGDALVTGLDAVYAIGRQLAEATSAATRRTAWSS